MDDKSMLEKIYDKVNGNGSDGLVTRTARLETAVEMHLKADADFKAWLRKAIFWIIGALGAAIGSPWLKDGAEYAMHAGAFRDAPDVSQKVNGNCSD